MKRQFKSGDTVLRKTEIDHRNSGTILWFSHDRRSVWVCWFRTNKPKHESIKDLVSLQEWQIMRRLAEPQEWRDFLLLRWHMIATLFAKEPTLSLDELGARLGYHRRTASKYKQ